MCGFVVEIVKDFNSLSVNEEKMSLIKKMTYEISHSEVQIVLNLLEVIGT